MYNKTNQPPTLAELIEEAKLEGRKVGREKGRKVGRKQGRKEGRKEAAKSIAKKMIRENYPHQEITKITGLANSEIKLIHKEVQ
jgi:predicted transposase YdaD